MVRGSSRRRDANCTPRLAEDHQIKHDEGIELHKPVVADSTDKQDKANSLHVSAALHRLDGRHRGPWGGSKCWLDMTSKPRLTNNLSVKNRLLMARWYWANTRLLRSSPTEDFFPASFRYRGHEGCVNAIKCVSSVFSSGIRFASRPPDLVPPIRLPMQHINPPLSLRPLALHL
ncbi:hypothetical protein ACSSS7_001687 [Eimeria intestinalis]